MPGIRRAPSSLYLSSAVGRSVGNPLSSRDAFTVRKQRLGTRINRSAYFIAVVSRSRYFSLSARKSMQYLIGPTGRSAIRCPNAGSLKNKGPDRRRESRPSEFHAVRSAISGEQRGRADNLFHSDAIAELPAIEPRHSRRGDLRRIRE